MSLKHNAFLERRPHLLKPQNRRTTQGREMRVQCNSARSQQSTFNRDALTFIAVPRMETKGVSIIGSKSVFVLDSLHPRNALAVGYSAPLSSFLVRRGNSAPLITVCADCSDEETATRESPSHGL